MELELKKLIENRRVSSIEFALLSKSYKLWFKKATIGFDLGLNFFPMDSQTYFGQGSSLRYLHRNCTLSKVSVLSVRIFIGITWHALKSKRLAT